MFGGHNGRVSFEEHLNFPRSRGPVAGGAVVGSAGGAPCGDLVRISLRCEQGRLTDVTFDAEGCGAAVAAGSACASLADGALAAGGGGDRAA